MKTINYHSIKMQQQQQYKLNVERIKEERKKAIHDELIKATYIENYVAKIN